MATTSIPKPRQLRLVRSPANRVEAEVLLATMARWIARQHVREENEGKEWDPVQLANAVTAYVIEHRSRLRTEAKLILSGEEKL